jgi:hypothetical protein
MRATLTGSHAFVDADGTRAKSNDVEKAAGHDEVLIKMDHVLHVARRQMDAESGAEAEQQEQRRSPAGLEADQNAQTAEQMNRDRHPDRDAGHRNIEAREIGRGPRRIAQLKDIAPKNPTNSRKGDL